MNKKNIIGLLCILVSFIIYMAFFINSLQKKNEKLEHQFNELSKAFVETQIIEDKIKNSNRIIVRQAFNNAWLEGCIACMKNIANNNGMINKTKLDSVKTLDSLVFINTIKN